MFRRASQSCFAPIVEKREPWNNERTMANNSFGTKMEQNTKQSRAHLQAAALSSSLKLGVMGTVLVWVLTASAQSLTTSTNFPVNEIIPDGNMSGLASAQTISTPITNVTDLKVTLKITGTWNGDLYCFLTHSSGHSVLLNRVGRRSASELGYNDPGLDATFDDAATNGDSHIYRVQFDSTQNIPIPNPLTGVWAADARLAQSASVVDTDARSAFLSSFNGVDPNGEWVLFVADVEAGDVHILDNWGLEITGDTAPTGPEQSFGQGEASTEDATVTPRVINQVQSQAVAPTSVVPAVLRGITAGMDGIKLTFSASPGYTYQIERASSLQNSGTVWTNIGTATTDASGQGEFTDSNPPATQAYYRTVSP
jgi:subtilisin-like proprotein convertase family protein